MFRGLFKGSSKKDKSEYFEKVDPVVEQRRKEKFSTPLIYDDFENKEKAVQAQKVTTEKEVKVAKKPKVMKKEKIELEIEKPTKTGYQPIEVLSPIRGVTGIKQSKPIVTKTPKKAKKRKMDDQLIPIISPFHGAFDKEEEIVLEDAVLQPAEETKTTSTPTVKVVEEKVPTVEENLRNIAKIVEEEKDQLKIIEERTGEFKLDFGETVPDKTTLIDEIDDNMSLDELMSLYEKKFTD